ncbi:hypothetical protein ACG2F4_02125 [Halalkalibaculum sp. DA3122]|uniref:hypothetical protein n=1 Tax=Halalkalibaculum sp. DA3122 TaxID=3373607 RepID=UPI0037549166
MSEESRKQRERLKEEYKQHYRKMREAKEQLNRTRRKRNITEALRNMDTSELMDSFDDLLFTVKSKIASVEARLDVAMESLAEDEKQHGGMSEQERDEEMQKTKARETLKQVKLEMGKLYNEIERQAGNMHVEKTVGSAKSPPEDDTTQSES